MTIIKRRKNNIGDKAKNIEKLAQELADKPYGYSKAIDKNDEIVRTTISLPAHLLFKIEDIAKDNKRNKTGLKSVSALIRHALENQFN